jgi:hypothetical protein
MLSQKTIGLIKAQFAQRKVAQDVGSPVQEIFPELKTSLETDEQKFGATPGSFLTVLTTILGLATKFGPVIFQIIQAILPILNPTPAPGPTPTVPAAAGPDITKAE